MKKFLLLVLAFTVFACTPTQLEENATEEQGFSEACPAPDTNCNGIPDHLE